MKSDLDRLMKENDIAALLVTGAAQHNPAMFYMTGGGHLTHADLIKAEGEEPVLFYSPMERDEARKSGLKTINLVEYNQTELLKQTGGDRVRANALRYRKMLEDAGVTAGRVSIYGKTELNSAFAVFKALEKLMPEIELIGEPDGNSVMLQAMATKEPDEIDRIRRMGAITTEVVGLTAEFLSSHTAKNGILVKRDGSVLTVGDVKRRVNLWLAERDAEAPEGFIFAIGRDAGVPHSTGTNSDPIALGKTIVYDIYPCEKGGGYYYDFTRTWCVGYAPDAAEAVYDDVRTTYDSIMQALKAHEATAQYQDQTCDLFEAQGHPTIRQNQATQEGYVHSLGHGLGLHVHEAPWFRSGAGASPNDVLNPGVVVTIEPGLYYPEKGLGVRLEDTVVAREDGTLEKLADYPLDLVIPVKQG